MADFPQGFSHIDKGCRNAGERRVLHQLKRCLPDDYLVWHDVPIGPRQRQPDFVVFSPRRGLLILEVKDWGHGNLHSINRHSVELLTERGLVTLPHPLQQARGYAMEISNVLQADAALRHADGLFKGKCCVPYGWGCVMAKIERKQVEGSDFFEVFAEHSTLLKGDLLETVAPYDFEKRLWGMYTLTFPHALSLPQRDRVRWHLFPEIRLPAVQGTLPDLLQVMDLEQEKLARTLGEGHRVVHGVAGAGKTLVLIYRAQQLAAAAQPDQPVLVLCFNRMLAQRIALALTQKGVYANKVVVRTFHAWCGDMVRSYQLDKPRAARGTTAYYVELAAIVQRALDVKLMPGGQYLALLIDEAHDFEDAWLAMAARLVSPATDSLLVMYDEAQSIYQKTRRKFNFASVGIKAQGRTSTLKMNYRNTAEVLALAMQCASGILLEDKKAPQPQPAQPSNINDNDNGSINDDFIQWVMPSTAGRHGPMPVLLQAKGAQQEALQIAQSLVAACAGGASPGEIAVLCRSKRQMDAIEIALRQHGVPCQSMNTPGFASFDWPHPSVKIITLHSVKGLEFRVVCIAGLDVMPMGGEPMDDELRLLYVGMTRATHALLLSCAGPSPMVQRVQQSLEAVAAKLAPP